MKRGLDQVLRIRKLLEEASQFEFEKRASELRELERAARHLHDLYATARTECLDCLTTGAASGTSWLTGTGDAEILRWKQGRVQSMAAASEQRMEAARQERLARRMESRQAELLIGFRNQAQQQSQSRRDQMHLDDWFQGISRRRRAQKGMRVLL